MSPVERPTTSLWSAAWIATAEGALLPDHAIVVCDGRIEAVGPRRSLRSAAREAHHWDGLLMAGLIDTHAHREVASSLKAPFQNLFELMTAVGDQRRRSTTQQLAQVQAAAAASGARRGVTCSVDWVSPRSEVTPVVTRSVRAVEVIGPDPRAEEVIVPAALKAAAAQAAAHPERQRVALAPHSPYMTCAPLWRRLGQASRANGWLLTSHVGETREEGQWALTGGGPLADHCRSRSGIARPPQNRGLLDLVLQLAPSGSRPLLVHGTFLNERELAQMARGGIPLCVCPSSNLQVTGRTVSLGQLLSANLRFTIGSDSCQGDQDLFREGRLLLRQLDGRERRTRVGAARALLRAMTITAGETIGWPELGSLRPGAAADFCLVRSDLRGAEDWELQVLEDGQCLGAVVAGEAVEETSPSNVQPSEIGQLEIGDHDQR
jgi:5-methylthioadenosine/S-adenosylhomocysteine deaminase